MQNKLIRFIMKLEPRGNQGTVLVKRNKKIVVMLKVNKLVKQLKLNYILKMYYEKAPKHLSYHFRKLSNIHIYI